jgi:hypothetical protein
MVYRARVPALFICDPLLWKTVQSAAKWQKK